MDTQRKSFGKKFKKLSRKNQTSLTFAEKTSKLSATDAIDTLLSRNNTHDTTESYQDIINAFSQNIKQKQKHYKHYKHQNYLNKQQERDYRYHENKQRRKTSNIEQVTKEIHPSQLKKKTPKIQKPLRTLNEDNDDNNDTLDSSSNHNCKKRSFSTLNEPEIKPLSPPTKKQKFINTEEEEHNDNDTNNNSDIINTDIINIDIKDQYVLHWNTRYQNRDKEILPILRQRRKHVMHKMDILMDNYICFIDRDCDNIPITKRMNNNILHYNSDILNNYKYKNNLRNNLLMSCISSYRDLLFCDRNYKNDLQIKQILTIHILSHILRNQNIRHNNDIKIRENEYIECDINDNLIRDSGFKRLSILIITPFKENVRKFAENILMYLPNERKLKNARYKKFMEEYALNKDNKLQGRGKEFEEIFSGDISDDFWCGIGIDKKGINFLQNWYYSDIIFISPLRLKLIFDKGITHDGRSVFDFFSSIEIMIIDQLDICEMQNITHLFDTLHKINWHPKLKKDDDIKTVNFDRLRYCYIDDVSQFYRQNIFITKHQTPKIKQLFQQRSMNIFGKIKIENKNNSAGILEKIIPFVRQEFYRFDVDKKNKNNNNINDVNELRLEIYKKYMLPIFRRNSGVKTLIFVSSYYDFLRLRNLYKNVENIKFLSEYTIKSNEMKYRRGFGNKGNQDIMYLVITERYYFYKRLKCDGAQRVLFYSLPQNKEYYYQILNWFDTKKEYESYTLYCKTYDNLALQRIVGLKRMIKMLNNKNNKQVFI